MSFSRIKTRSLLLSSFCLAVAFGAASPSFAQQAADGAVTADDTPIVPAKAFPSIIALDPGNSVWTLKVNQGTLKVNGDVAVNSTNQGALWMGAGTLDVKNGTVNVVGGVSRVGRTSITPTPGMGGRVTEDPLPEFMVPSPGNVMSQEKLFLNTDEEDKTLPPGVYAGGIFATGKGHITLQPGVFVIANGDFSAIGPMVEGEGVTIVMAGDNPGALSFSLGAQLNASAPTSGKLKGLVVVSRAAGRMARGVAFAQAAANLQGLVYAPNASVEASSKSQVKISKIIAQSVSVDGAQMEVTGSSAVAAAQDANQ